MNTNVEAGQSVAVGYSRSAQLLERAQRVLAGGVSSEFRKYNAPHPLFYQRGHGAWITDVDGNTSLDFTLSQGPLILGHSHPHVLRRVEEASREGQLYAGQHLLELELAEALQRLIPCAERVRFSLSGSEANHAALRVARAVTGRPRFLRFEGHYHGWLDNVAYAIGGTAETLGERDHPAAPAWSEGLPPAARDEFHVLPWNDLARLERFVARHAGDLAAIITEPMMCNSGCIPPEPGFLEGMRELCDRYDIALIFDEVITGFRLSLGGAGQHYGVTPDLGVFGKALASGYPISALVGKERWMRPISEGRVIHAGTMNSGVPSVAAALATLEVLEGEDVHARLHRLGAQLAAGLREAGREARRPLHVQGPGPMVQVGFTALPSVRDYRDTLSYDRPEYARFVDGMQARGIRLMGRGLWYLSHAHAEEDIVHAVRAAAAVLAEL